VVSKARVSLRAVTIPKMELMAAVLGSRLLTAMKIRVIGRIHKSKFLSDETKQPIILDGRHEVLECMVHHYHVKHMHYGVKTLLNFLKQKFHITKMRSVAKKVFYDCGYCKKLKSGSKALQMGNLPDFRLTAYSPTFTNTRLDFFGTLLISMTDVETVLV
jgi:hypothetical protein